MNTKQLATQTGISILKMVIIPIICFFILRQVSRIMQGVVSSGSGPSLVFLAPGTIIHEGSHWLFMKIFSFGTIHFQEVQLFSPKTAPNGATTLGYVVPLYNKLNPLHQMGLFFGGFAPVVGISSVLGAIYYAVFPKTMQKIVHGFNNKSILANIKSTFRTILSPIDKDVAWWAIALLVLAVIIIGTGFTLSNSDFFSMLHGCFTPILLVMILSLLGILTPDIQNGFLVIFVSMMMILTIIMLVLGMILTFIF
ncbi:hypothetical protein Hs30E_08880 [Lactococcus hodotermopsidis]|uniref:Uncharacterized protein n=1 Tax=Pseudolactococcus hodotermopsidis TaxID=2709157 RepID=A0A6A0BES4_9LACT|nr:hypothetical protein [Lactococcus hodotermopsidis]GFH42337.1 hypothetical protein Hs30E_08880 [Lactococcus hodotermopsidis]